MKPHADPLHVHAQYAHNGVCDYYDRAGQFATEAQTKTPASDPDGMTHWTPQLLREVSHLHELEQECYDAARVCMSHYQRATRRAYQRTQLVAVCTTTRHRDHYLSSRAIATQYATQLQRKDRDTHPPGQLLTLSPIATCAASNAPGSVRHAITTGDTATK